MAPYMGNGHSNCWIHTEPQWSTPAYMHGKESPVAEAAWVKYSQYQAEEEPCYVEPTTIPDEVMSEPEDSHANEGEATA